MNSLQLPAVVLLCLVLLIQTSGCYSHLMHAQPTAEFADIDNRLSSTPDSSVVAWTFAWGGVDAKKELKPERGKTMKSVKVRSNIWTGLVTVLTAGLVRPKIVEWWYAKNTPCVGSTDSAPAVVAAQNSKE